MTICSDVDNLSEIAEQVTKKLDVTVLEPERKVLENHPIDNIEAYDCYLRAGEHAALAWRALDVREFAGGGLKEIM